MFRVSLTAFTGALLLALPASAESFLAATWLSETSPNGRFMTEYADQIDKATSGDITMELYSGGALLPPDGSLSGLSSNVAQLVHITGAYMPSDLPLDNLLSDYAFAYEGSHMALAFASIDTKMNSPEMQEEYKKHDAVYVSGFSNGPYNLICKGEVADLADLAGKKIRVTSSAHVAWLKQVNAVSVNVPGSEIYTGLQRGSIDCAIGDPLFLTQYFNLVEVADSVTTLSLGWVDTGGYFFNRDFWQERSPEERRELLDAAAMATAINMVEWGESLEGAYAAANEEGVAVLAPTAELEEQMNAYKVAYRNDFVPFEMDKRNISDPSELVAASARNQERWNRILDGVDITDVNAVAQVLKTEIYDKIDVTTYGVD